MCQRLRELKNPGSIKKISKSNFSTIAINSIPQQISLLEASNFQSFVYGNNSKYPSLATHEEKESKLPKIIEIDDDGDTLIINNTLIN